MLSKVGYYWQLEWLKMWHSVTFRVIGSLYLVLLLGIGLSVRNFEFDGKMEAGYFLMFPNVWESLGWAGQWLSFFMLGILVLLMVTQEYGNRTLRQNIINGMTRQGIWTSKVLFMLSLAAVATLFYAFSCLVFGFIYTDHIYASRVTVGLGASLRYFVMCFGFMSLAFMLAFLIRKSGLAIFLYFGYVMFIEAILRYAVHHQMIKGRSMLFWPANIFEELTPIPVPKMLANMVKEFGAVTSSEALITAGIYISLFLYVAWYRVTRTDM